VVIFYFSDFFSWWDWGLNSQLDDCKAGSLFLEPHLQPRSDYFGSEAHMNYLPRLASYHNPLHLQLTRIIGVSLEYLSAYWIIFKKNYYAFIIISMKKQVIMIYLISYRKNTLHFLNCLVIILLIVCHWTLLHTCTPFLRQVSIYLLSSWLSLPNAGITAPHSVSIPS
jgi:hypothetical protein